MRYIKGKVHFSKKELSVFEKLNPTLFDLAHYVADIADITPVSKGDNWVSVTYNSRYSNFNENEPELVCPQEVFSVPNIEIDSEDDSIELKCSTLRCWNTKVDAYGNRPCWLRRWNEFVADMTTQDTEED